MIINFEQPIPMIDGDSLFEYKPVMGKNGKPELDDDGEEKIQKVSLPLGTMCNRALLGTYQEDRDEKAEDKLGRWELAKKIKANDEVTIEEVALIKKYVGKAFGPGLMGPIFDILESSAVSKNGDGKGKKGK